MEIVYAIIIYAKLSSETVDILPERYSNYNKCVNSVRVIKNELPIKFGVRCIGLKREKQ